ncbi:MAG: hypothetical protein HFG36_06810 [Eubacterium sp.]|nr:hypothetical protein [Eubacterium sp.]
MNNKIRSFLRLRKQSDTVKIICLFVLAATAFFISVIYHAWDIYRFVNTPAEYVLTGEGTVSQKRVDELIQMGDVAAVSRQMEVPVTVLYQGMSTTVNCSLLSQGYIEKLLAIKLPTGTKRIYMNETAFSEMLQGFSEENEDLTDVESLKPADGSTEFDIRYSMEETMADPKGDGEAASMGASAAGSYKSARLNVVKDDGQEEKALACTAEAEGRLFKDACSLRVLFDRHDLDGLHVEQLGKLGYEIENEEAVIMEENEIKIKLLHIQYGLLSFGICLIAIFTLKIAAEKGWDRW